ncbi:MAG: stage II sporulation protein M [Verrucomicrobiota bacterium]
MTGSLRGLAHSRIVLNVILDLDRFIAKERPFWEELASLLRLQEEDPDRRPPLDEAKRFLYLYQRTSTDLVKLKTFAGEVETTRFLERLIARAYSRLHESGGESVPFRPWEWLTRTFPRTFRRHWIAFAIACTTFWVGAGFGAGALAINYNLKSQFIPAQFSHLNEKPSKRVEREEKQDFDAFQGRHSFSAELMTNNTKVTILTMVTGFFWGIFTIILLFYNGTIIGVVMFDYLTDGQGTFLTAWLLPHGSFELPAIFMGGQAGLIIARTMFGWRSNLKLRERFARIRGDLLTLVGGAALMLVWAGIVESFLSQYHSPPFYPWKIGFGAIQLIALILFLAFCGRRNRTSEED